ARIVDAPKSVSVQEGQSVSITCKIEGIPAPTATWTIKDKPVSSDDRHLINLTPDTVTLTIPKAVVEDTAVYTLKISNPSGTDDVSVEVTITGG
ncbi:hypothetical protein LOTGIDRAFT_141570, partial [Lottia gigantea]